MKRIHIIAISVLIGFIAGVAAPVHAAEPAKTDETTKAINDALKSMDDISAVFDGAVKDVLSHRGKYRLTEANNKKLVDIAQNGMKLANCSAYAQILSNNHDGSNNAQIFGNKADYFANAAYQEFGTVHLNMKKISDSAIQKIPMTIIFTEADYPNGSAAENAKTTTLGAIKWETDKAIGNPNAFTEAQANYTKSQCELLIK